MTRRLPSALRYAGGIAALAVVAALWLAFAPTRLGGSVDYAVIYGTSMEPGLHRGDLVVLQTRADYAVGDAVGYHNRQLGRVVLHRIVGRVGDRYVFKGDNNDFLDAYHPTRSELIGRMWVRVPGAGRALLWLRAPTHAAIGVALLVLVLLGGGSKEVRRRRQRRPVRARVVVPPRHEPAPQAVSASPRAGASRALLAVGGAGLVLCGVLAAVAYGSGTTRRVDAPGAYTHQGAWSYSARGAAGAVYPGGEIETGQTVFAQLVRRVRIGFSYRFASALPHDVAGTASLDARLTSMLGWTKPLPGAAEQSFHGDSVELETTLDMRQLEHALAAYYKATGVPSDSFNVVLTPKIEARGTVAGRRIDTSFEPTPLSFTLDAFALRLETPTSDGGPGAAPADPLHPGAPGSIERFVPRTVGFVGVSVVAARRLAAGGLLASLALALLALLLGRVTRGGGDELSRIRREHAGLIVPVQSAPPPPEGGYVDVADLESLAHLAASYERMILHLREEGVDSFYVDDDGSVYRYRHGSAEPPPLPRTLASPVLR